MSPARDDTGNLDLEFIQKLGLFTLQCWLWEIWELIHETLHGVTEIEALMGWDDDVSPGAYYW